MRKTNSDKNGGENYYNMQDSGGGQRNNELNNGGEHNKKRRGSGGWLFGMDSEIGGGRLSKTRFITHAALIAAVYAALTIWLAPIAFGQRQIRVAEALSILPAFTPAAIPGLFIGCAIANTMSFFGLPDLIFGSLATLISAQSTYMLARLTRERGAALQAILLPLPAILVNTVVIGAMISILTGVTFNITALGVMTGQALSCYGLGVPLYFLLRGYARYSKALFSKK